MRSPHRVLIACLAGAGVLLVPAGPSAEPQSPIFRFATEGFWLNLHGFLYVLGRDAAEMPDRTREAVAAAPAEADRALASMSSADRETWREAVEAYGRTYSQRDAVFGTELVTATNALVRAGGGDLPTTDLMEGQRELLDGVGPIYRRAWWSDHQRANQAWVASMRPLLERHGAEVLAFITRAYGEAWPDDGYPVNLSGYANWAGAYSTMGNLLVIGSKAPTVTGSAGLEIAFHEAMHQWDEEIDAALAVAGQTTGVAVPGDLSHAMIFYTAGEAVRRAVPGHVPYAEGRGMWDRGMGAFKPALDAAWRPWLAGSGSRDAALVALLRRLGTRQSVTQK